MGVRGLGLQDVLSLKAELDETHPHFSYVVYKGKKLVGSYQIDELDQDSFDSGHCVYERSVGTIFWFLFSGYSQAEITSILQVSRPWVSKKVAFLKEFEPTREWVTPSGLRLPRS